MRTEAFRLGLRNLGYVEGQNIVIEWRSADETLNRLPALAAELVDLKVAVIVAGDNASTAAAKEVTKTVPIVMATSADPVGIGLVASLARPGGNVTGLTSLSIELWGKQVGLLKELVPALSRVAVLSSPPIPRTLARCERSRPLPGGWGCRFSLWKFARRSSLTTRSPR